MVDVRWQVYCITLVFGGGCAVIMACWRWCRPSASVWFPHMHWSRMCFVMGVPLLFTSLQLSGSVLMMLLSVAGPIVRASIIREM